MKISRNHPLLLIIKIKNMEIIGPKKYQGFSVMMLPSNISKGRSSSKLQTRKGLRRNTSKMSNLTCWKSSEGQSDIA